MAQANYKFKMGSATCELITGYKFTTTGQEEVTHTMGVIPDHVIITNKAAYSVYKSADSTASVIKLTAGNAGGACDILLIHDSAKIKTA